MSNNGAADSDFLLGSWKVHNRKLRDVTDRACTEWIEFDARREVVSILRGGGNFAQMTVDDPPDGTAFGATPFEWLAGVSPRWQQSVTYEDGVVGPLNWIMTFERVS